MRIRPAAPNFSEPVQARAILDLHHLALTLHGAIPREMPLRLRPRLLWTVPTGQRIRALHITRDLCRHANPYLPSPHFGKTNGAFAPVGFVVVMLVPFANLLERTAQVPIPL